MAKGDSLCSLSSFKDCSGTKKKFVQQFLNAYLYLSRVQLPLYLNKEEESSLMSPKEYQGPRSKFRSGGVWGGG